MYVVSQPKASSQKLTNVDKRREGRKAGVFCVLGFTLNLLKAALSISHSHEHAALIQDSKLSMKKLPVPSFFGVALAAQVKGDTYQI